MRASEIQVGLVEFSNYQTDWLVEKKVSFRPCHHPPNTRLHYCEAGPCVCVCVCVLCLNPDQLHS